jgi:hypothetical protein
MLLRLGTIVVAAAALAALAGQAAGQRAAPLALKTKVCGQIKHGPHASYVSLLFHKKLSGTTWTVFSTGIPCRKTMKVAPAVLKWWKTAKVDSHKTVKRFTCNKENDGHGHSGSSGCIPATTAYPALANFELIMTGKYTLAQLRALFGGG